jgi:hypothetical protein
MRIIIAKTRVVSYTKQTNFLNYTYEFCHATIICSSTKDLGVFFDSKLHFHSQVDYLFSKCRKLLGLIQSVTYFPPWSVYICHNFFIQVQVGICLGSLERFSASSRSLRPSVSLSRVPYSYTIALGELSLHSLLKRDITLRHFISGLLWL